MSTCPYCGARVHYDEETKKIKKLEEDLAKAKKIPFLRYVLKIIGTIFCVIAIMGTLGDIESSQESLIQQWPSVILFILALIAIVYMRKKK